MLRQLLNENGRVSRRITLSSTLVVNITDAPESWLPTKWDEPETVTLEEDPRDTTPFLLRYTTRLRGLDRGVPLQVGDRIERKLDDTIYELVTPPAPINVGGQLEGFQVRVLQVNVMYPVVAALHEQGDTEVLPSVRCAIWNPSEEAQPQGDYFTHNARCPLDFATFYRPNRLFNVGGSKYRIVTALINHNLRCVELTVRSSRG